MRKKILALLFPLLLCSLTLSASLWPGNRYDGAGCTHYVTPRAVGPGDDVVEVTDTVRIYFEKGYSRLDVNFGSNRRNLRILVKDIRNILESDSLTCQSILIVGGASPEGNVSNDKRLAEKRAESVKKYLEQKLDIPAGLVSIESVGRDWEGLLQLVIDDDNVPNHWGTAEYLCYIISSIEESDGVENESDHYINKIYHFEDGVPYQYMFDNLFPELRATNVFISYEEPAVVEEEPLPEPEEEVEPEPEEEVVAEEEPASSKRNFYMGIKTNMLYDALLVPNIGAEFYLGRCWSIGADWGYAWWKKDGRSWYWRYYGGDLYLRKWIGKKAKEKPLQGHHLGLYGQMLSYDFETGNKGYLADRWSWAVALEYGYSLPITRRLNIDFGLGLGYMGGEYKKYTAAETQKNRYIWQKTVDRHYFGPTKAEVSLVWLIGRGNHNADKGKKSKN